MVKICTIVTFIKRPLQADKQEAIGSIRISLISLLLIDLTSSLRLTASPIFAAYLPANAFALALQRTAVKIF